MEQMKTENKMENMIKLKIDRNKILYKFYSSPNLNSLLIQTIQSAPKLFCAQIECPALIKQPFSLSNLSPNLEQRVWVYIDENNKVQGPFTTLEMDFWNINGLLPQDLMVGMVGMDTFIKLSEFAKFYYEKEKNQKHSITPKKSGVSLQTKQVHQKKDLQLIRSENSSAKTSEKNTPVQTPERNNQTSFDFVDDRKIGPAQQKQDKAAKTAQSGAMEQDKKITNTKEEEKTRKISADLNLNSNLTYQTNTINQSTHQKEGSNIRKGSTDNNQIDTSKKENSEPKKNKKLDDGFQKVQKKKKKNKNKNKNSDVLSYEPKK